MAQLNVRERAIEATIAYVGSALSGKSTNLERLAREARAERLDADPDRPSLSWRANASEFRDCRLRVKVVAARGAAEEDRARALMREADGVVLVLDTDPQGLERHRASARALRETLEGASGRAVPVVVQLNKTDLGGVAAVIAGDVGVGEWPFIAASALHGEGVVETLDRAIASVVEQLVHGDPNGGEPAREGQRLAPAGEGNPLLLALKQVLCETAERHLAEIHARGAGELEVPRATLDQILQSQRAATDALDRLEQRLASMEARLADLGDESKRRKRGWFSS